MSEASRLAAISAFLLKHRSSPVFRSRREPPPGVEPEAPSEDAETFTRERPGAALGLAAGAGFLLAMMLSRR